MKDTQLKLSYHERKLSLPIRNSKESYNYFLSIWDKSLVNLLEQVYIIYLNKNNEVICWRCLGTGSGDKCIFDLKLSVSCGLQCMASKVIIAHNHPSGDLAPSKADIQITNKLHSAFELLEIYLLDHLILSPENYYSFTDHHLKIA